MTTCLFPVGSQFPEFLVVECAVLVGVEADWRGIRHSCEIGDDMASYGWTEYDGRLGGVQNISDRGMKLDIQTEFVKLPGPNGTPALTLNIWDRG
jgi:hypothetical protein